MLDHLNLISSTLKNLVVHACDYIQNGEIQAPQLVFFQFIGKIVEFSTIIVSGDLDVELHLESRPYHDIDYVQLIKLKKLLGNFDQARVLTIISKQHLGKYIYIFLLSSTYYWLINATSLIFFFQWNSLINNGLIRGVASKSFFWRKQHAQSHS